MSTFANLRPEQLYLQNKWEGGREKSQVMLNKPFILLPSLQAKKADFQSV